MQNQYLLEIAIKNYFKKTIFSTNFDRFCKSKVV
nr:MAG TPA_asm: hypothetical protein [Caudoviricetes sp.]DAV08855.1 MAG TPA: hypothetical protein [Caudoviricetes sp.]